MPSRKNKAEPLCIAAENLALLLASGGRVPPSKIHKYSRALRDDLQRAARWLWDRNITGVAVADKVSSGKVVPGRLSLTFFVRRKLPKARLRTWERIPARFAMESVEQDIPTDVCVLRGAPVAHAGAPIRPVCPGISIGHFSGEEGTVTLAVRRRNSSAAMLLTCSHAAALGGRADRGDSIEQPADNSGAVGPNRIGSLAEFTTLRSNIINSMDAALISLDSNIRAKSDVLGLGSIAGVSQASPMQMKGKRIVLRGANSGEQRGEITAFHAFFKMSVPALGNEVVKIGPVLRHTAPMRAGDSGAPVLDSDRDEVLGMHIAEGLFSPIQPVLDHFEIELLSPN